MNANEANKLKIHYPKMVTASGCIAVHVLTKCV